MRFLWRLQWCLWWFMIYDDYDGRCYEKVAGLPPFSSLPQDRLLLPIIWSVINMIMVMVEIISTFIMRMVEMRVDLILDTNSIQHSIPFQVWEFNWHPSRVVDDNLERRSPTPCCYGQGCHCGCSCHPSPPGFFWDGAKIHTVMMAAVAMEKFSSFITLLDLPAAPPYCLDLQPHNELG